MPPRGGSLSVRPVVSKSDRAAWLALPSAIMSGDPNWIAPLDIQERRRISPGGNPFFTFGEAELFIAWRDGLPVGRISAQVNSRHIARYADATGHFGFFDCHDDQEAATALVEAARNWLRARNVTRMIGPMSFSINEEVGLLIDGFDTPPAILMGHAPRWAKALLEGAGLSKAVDTYAYRMCPANAPPVVRRLARLARNSGRVSVRKFEMSRYRSEVQTLIEIFNDAWSDNWGFMPFSDAEIDALISETRFLFRGQYGRFLLVDGEPVGVMLALPDLNDVIRDFHGRLWPLNWMPLIAAFLRARWRTARIPLLGLRKSFRGNPLAPAMLAMLVSEFNEEARSYPLDWVEFSWVLETNKPMLTLANLTAGPPVKTYRIFSTEL